MAAFDVRPNIADAPQHLLQTSLVLVRDRDRSMGIAHVCLCSASG